MEESISQITSNPALSQAFADHPFAVLAGVALVGFALFLGMAILYNGWPKFRK